MTSGWPPALGTARRRAAALLGHQHLAKSVAELGTEETVDDWIDGTAGQSDPLGHRDDGLSQQLELGFVDVQRWPEEDSDVDSVQRQPAERKDNHDNDQHLDDTNLRSVDDLRANTHAANIASR